MLSQPSPPSGFETQVRTVEKTGYTAYYITLFLKKGETTASFFERFVSILTDYHATLLRVTILGEVEAYAACMKELKEAGGEILYPVTWIEGNNGKDKPISGLTAVAVSGVPVEPVVLSDRIVGSVFETSLSKRLYLGNLFSTNATLPEPVQTEQLFDSIMEILGQVGMNFSHIIRTWYYLDDILGWYDQFNKVRTKFFEKQGVFEGLVPASTGIGGKNPLGTALTFEAIAIQPKTEETKIMDAESPKQGSAMSYGSSFSRAVEVAEPGCRTVYISGTASIDQEGNTVFLNDIDKQIDKTMDVVSGILQTCDMTFADVVRSVVYVKEAKDIPAFQHYYLEQAYAFPAIEGENTVCRDNLLFEIEVDALKKV
ncbi:hypothetical protein GF373_02445 [bacterium]|nr:hypothetical protein [bacterium]